MSLCWSSFVLILHVEVPSVSANILGDRKLMTVLPIVITGLINSKILFSHIISSKIIGLFILSPTVSSWTCCWNLWSGLINIKLAIISCHLFCAFLLFIALLQGWNFVIRLSSYTMQFFTLLFDCFKVNAFSNLKRKFLSSLTGCFSYQFWSNKVSSKVACRGDWIMASWC